ncbi:uncharacterized protein RCC_07720 [Ramularia collo-cygni]|uniref:Uncharacterized protein n=1 Tax=Ramularia collo-cygni TaxID=112498 RepID=A0A2D3VL21_9PEZI|nr:uncharacterized protein RCC_07720 [Ramularia collo-cygni]CZT21853.1 uncharacterized protein RCC_07720 [Ramularia collo-cygni]
MNLFANNVDWNIIKVSHLHVYRTQCWDLS